jgi:hypothetical protein
MHFETGQSKNSDAFYERYPNFEPVFDKLMVLGNNCFGREVKAKNWMERICFDLGHTCRDDFLEVFFMAIHGHGSAALKLLRGLYERAVTLAYIAKYPDKAEKFRNYSAVQENKALNAALRLVTEEQFNEANKGSGSADEIRRWYNQVKPEFEVTRCRKCGDRGIAFSWDVDLASMVQNVGNPFDEYYLAAYTIPNFHVHATFATTFDGAPEEARIKRRENESEFALGASMGLLLQVMHTENEVFHLGVESDIASINEYLKNVWNPD